MNSINLENYIDSNEYLKIEKQTLDQVFPFMSEIKDELKKIMFINLLQFNAISYVASHDFIFTQNYIPFQESYFGQRSIGFTPNYSSADFPYKGFLDDQVVSITRTNLFILKSQLFNSSELVEDLHVFKAVYPSGIFLESLISGDQKVYQKHELIIPQIYT